MVPQGAAQVYFLCIYSLFAHIVHEMTISYLSYEGKERGKAVWGLICNC